MLRNTLFTPEPALIVTGYALSTTLGGLHSAFPVTLFTVLVIEVCELSPPGK